MNIDNIKNYLLTLQNEICDQLSADESKEFQKDAWSYNEGGGGITRVLEDGAYIEKAGVNFSHIRGNKLPATASSRHPELANKHFEALGVSLIIHPRNPYAPTTHMNVRFIVVDPEEEQNWWFGGGYDLTPYYGFVADCQHWHNTAKSACDKFGPELYPLYKQACDDYFYLKHRQETRGIGGIFFDDLNTGDFETDFAFMQSVGSSFLEAYKPIFNKRKHSVYTDKERKFQAWRRGRYVEFNLLYDRGTLFGLHSGGRTEAILVSLPPKVEWHYDYTPEPDSPEAAFKAEFLEPRDWVI